MHEYSLAKDILDTLLKEVEAYNAKKVREITLDIGPLAMVNIEQLLFCLKTVSRDTIAEGMEISIKTLPVRVECDNKHVSEISEEIDDIFDFVIKLRCSECGEKAKVISGRELLLKEIIAE